MSFRLICVFPNSRCLSNRHFYIQSRPTTVVAWNCCQQQHSRRVNLPGGRRHWSRSSCSPSRPFPLRPKTRRRQSTDNGTRHAHANRFRRSHCPSRTPRNYGACTATTTLPLPAAWTWHFRRFHSSRLELEWSGLRRVRFPLHRRRPPDGVWSCGAGTASPTRQRGRRRRSAAAVWRQRMQSSAMCQRTSAERERDVVWRSSRKDAWCVQSSYSWASPGVTVHHTSTIIVCYSQLLAEILICNKPPHSQKLPLPATSTTTRAISLWTTKTLNPLTIRL